MYSTKEIEKDYNVLYPESEKDEVLRKEQEELGKLRGQFFGAPQAISNKGRGSFKAKAPPVKRMKTFKIDTNSKPWKDYQDKKISFLEMKRLLMF